MLKAMFSKFAGKCAATGEPIRKGEPIQYDTVSRKAYKEGNQPTQNTSTEDNLSGYIQAQEEAYFDNQYRR